MNPDHASSIRPAMPNHYRIVRDDGISDSIAGRSFTSYNDAYDELERYYGDLCCSDDREHYRIIEETI